jgi:hypothetical protein
MNFLKIKLLVVAIVMFAASSAFASLSYNVSVDTSSLNNTDGYLYFQYDPINAADSIATVSAFSGGTLAIAPDTTNTLGGSTGTLTTGAGTVAFNTVNSTTDYNHGIHFGNTTNFLLSFSNPAANVPAGGSSTFSLSLFQDNLGSAPLLNGTLFTLSLMNDGTATTQILANEANVTSTPIPAAAWLLGSGLMGLVGLRRKQQK